MSNDDSSPPNYDHLPKQFNPNSTDAMFAHILATLKYNHQGVMERLDKQDVKLDAAVTVTAKQDERIDKLEDWKKEIKVRVSMIAVVAGSLISTAAWAIDHYIFNAKS